MKKFGLIGHPIAHSLSPALFKAGYDGRYTYDLIEEESFEAAYSRFINEYDGINVTAPFKEQAFAKLLPRTHNGAVVLLHSTSQTNAEILDELITRWKEDGYQFGTVEELFEMHNA